MQRQLVRARVRRLRRRDGLPGHRLDLPASASAGTRTPAASRTRPPERAAEPDADGQLQEGDLRQHGRRHLGRRQHRRARRRRQPVHRRRVRERRAHASGQGRRHRPAPARTAAQSALARAPACSAWSRRDCPGTDTLCRQRTCPADHTCGHTDTAAGTAAEPDATGNCHKALCDGAAASCPWSTTPTSRSTATPARRTCARAASPSNPNLPAGTTLCAPDGSKACDAAPALQRAHLPRRARRHGHGALSSGLDRGLRRRAAHERRRWSHRSRCRSPQRRATSRSRCRGSASSEGACRCPRTGDYLTLAGYVPRARTSRASRGRAGQPRRWPIDVAGTVNTSTSSPPATAATTSARATTSTASTSGSPARAAEPNGGVWYNQRGATTNETHIVAAPTASVAWRIFGDQLYGSSQGAFTERVQDRLRNADRRRPSPTSLPGMPTTARARTGSRCSISRWTSAGHRHACTSPTTQRPAEVDLQRHDLVAGGDVEHRRQRRLPRRRRLRGRRHVTLMASTAEDSPNRLVVFVDDGVGDGDRHRVATAARTRSFRGVAVSPHFQRRDARDQRAAPAPPRAARRGAAAASRRWRRAARRRPPAVGQPGCTRRGGQMLRPACSSAQVLAAGRDARLHRATWS